MDVEIVLEDVDDFADGSVESGVRIVSLDVDFDDVPSVVRARGGLGNVLHNWARGPNFISLMLN